MGAAPTNARRHFLPWGQPLVPQLAAWLADGWTGAESLDLTGTLAIVPTRQAGRRLREELARIAAGRGRAVFAPRVITPEGILASPEGGPPIASRARSIRAWSDVLGQVDLDAFRQVFPSDPSAKNFAWRFRLAEQFLKLQSALGEAGLRIADVADRAGGTPEFPEAGRWRQLAELERRYDQRLAESGQRDATQAEIDAARDPAAPAGISRVVVLATPDPLPLALQALVRLSERLPLDIVVCAPPEEIDAFDEWGRPRVEAWRERPLDLGAFDEAVRLLADPEEQADAVEALAGAYGAGADGVLGLGAADREVRIAIEAALHRGGHAVFNPEGRPRKSERLYPLLSALADLAREPAYAAVLALARCPDVLKCFARRAGPGFSPARWLAGLDGLWIRHLPADLDAARRRAPADIPELEQGLRIVSEWRTQLQQSSFEEGIARVLADIFGGPDGGPLDAALASAGAAWMEVVREVEPAGQRRLPPDEAWDFALRLFGEQADPGEKPAHAIEIQGWIELLWEDAPHLVLAGFNDGNVPESIVADAFLPEGARRSLGLRTSEHRLARDAYLLQAIAAARANGGRLELLVGKTSASGEPLRPSRLLFLCSDDALAGRVQRLFRAPALAAARPAWTRSWRLEPPIAPPPARVSVTALRRWLECPFRFYLRHVLRLEPLDAGKNEMDSLDFGILCHAALEAMGREATMLDCVAPAQLQDYLVAELELQTRRRFGTVLALPLVIQVESARQRLRRAAEVQAAERAAGWRIEAVERKLSVPVSGLEVVAKVDRIDRNERTGAVRVLDYKTSNAAVNPADAHLGSVRQDETPPPWAICPGSGRPRVWRDLQLPLYLHALAPEFGAAITCAYFNLPKAVGETGIAAWEPFPRESFESAIACAQAVCQAIGEGVFWPPSEKVRPADDDYAELFHRGSAASIDWRGKGS